MACVGFGEPSCSLTGAGVEAFWKGVRKPPDDTVKRTLLLNS